MIFTATPEPENRRIRLNFDTEVAGEFTSITVTRGGRPLRSQPPIAGLTQTLVYDYEAALGTQVAYMAEVVYSDGESVHAESWADLDGWNADWGSTPTVAGGVLTAGIVSRTDLAVPAVGRVAFAAPMPSGLDGFRIGNLWVTRSGAGFIQIGTGSEPLAGLLPVGVGSWSIQWSANQVTLKTSAGTRTASWGGMSGSTHITCWASMPSFEIFDMDSISAVRATLTATATLDTSEALLIHPSQPALTVAIDEPTSAHSRDLDIWVESSTDLTRGYGDDQSIFMPSGRAEAVAYPRGPRKAGSWTLTLRTGTLDARNQVLNLLADQAPLLLRSPAAADWDLPDGWYSVGSVRVDRVISYGPDPARLITLGLNRVAEPPVSVVPPLTWGDAAMSTMTWGDAFSAGFNWIDALLGEIVS